MRIYLNAALCKKCPFSVFRLCHYKRVFYQKMPKMDSKFKMMHNCTFYKNIYKKGQYVLIDLYHQFPSENGKWTYIPAYRDVPGVIKGTRGHKFVVELFDVYILNRKKRGKPHTNRVKICCECSRVAKDIRPLVLAKEKLEVLDNMPLRRPVLN